MKKLLIILSLLIILLGGGLVLTINKIEKLNTELVVQKTNNLAYEQENSELKDASIVFKKTMEQLTHSKDSLTIKLLQTTRELKIKDKQINSLQFIVSSTQKTDSIILRDTIFVSPDFKLDTLLYDSDGWYKLGLNLKYPNTVKVTPEFKDELEIITYDKKDYIDPPKKFFICRWFQRKHLIRTTIVMNKNPYSSIQEKRFIEIIK